MTYDEARWRYAAATLGLTVFDPVGGFARGASFDRLVRARGRPIEHGAAKSNLWMSGRPQVPAMQRDVEVIVLEDTVEMMVPKTLAAFVSGEESLRLIDDAS